MLESFSEIAIEVNRSDATRAPNVKLLHRLQYRICSWNCVAVG